MRRLASALGALAFVTFASAPALADGIQLGGGITVTLPPVVLPLPTPVAPAPPPPQAYPEPAYPQPAYRYSYAPPRPVYGASRLGLDLRLDGMAMSRSHQVFGLGGGGLGLRYRAAPHFGIEAGIDLLAGRDYARKSRLELAGTAGGLVYFNARSRAQVYLSGGFLLDYARSTSGTDYLASPARKFTHVGGYAGLGLEVFMTPRIALHVDARGVLRQNVAPGASTKPEFTEIDSVTGRTRSTNTSGGMIGSAGVVFYF